jgi:hypothetical protein
VSDASLPLPDYVGWPIFPFEGDLRVKQPTPIMADDIARAGEGGRSCSYACEQPDTAYLWVDDVWRVKTLDRSALPVGVMLETRDHLDLSDFTPQLGAQLGEMIVRIEHAMHRCDDIGRVHVNRWGDGGSHFHLWFMARPRGRMELYGYGLPLWYKILPPYEHDRWQVNNRIVAGALAETGGHVVGATS